MEFSEQQKKAIHRRGKNIVVSASAGSGKTSVLVERLCSLVIEDHIPIHAILAMTFTEDAASEMKARLKSRLSSLEPTPYVLDQLALLETADISTIDSFCYKLVQQFYYRIPISYAMALHVDNGPLRNQAFQQAYQRALYSFETSRIVEMNAYFRAFHFDEESFFSLLQRFLNIANAKADPLVWIESCKTRHSATLSWFYQFFKERIDSMIDIVKEMEQEIDQMEFSKIKTYEANRDLFRSKHLFLKRCQEDLNLDHYEDFARDFIAYIESTKRFPSTVNKVSFASIKKEFQDLEKDISSCLFDWHQLEEDEKSTQPILETWCDLSSLVLQFFQEEKEKAQILDFTDMEHFAYQLLLDPAIQEQIRNQYEMILIDEFQDTNDLQENIIQQIAQKDNVFRVGDIKQSIYGFRQAKPSIMIEHMKKKDDFHETLVLSENYRSSKTLIEFNNTFYQQIMNTEFLRAKFDETDAASPGTAKQEEEKQTPVRFLFTQYEPWAMDKNLTKMQARSIHRLHQVDLIAHDILNHHASGTPYRSICILTRTHSDHERIKEGLEAYGIPVLAEIDHGFYTNQAIQIILSCLKAIYDPHNDVALMAALCSPIGKVNQEILAQGLIGKEAELSLFSKLRKEKFMARFYDLLAFRSDPIPDLVSKLLNYENYYYQFTNGQDKTNLDLLLERASQYPDPYDLAGFIQEIDQEADLDKTSEAFPYGKEEDVVKIKTMHHSKGLQYPIVYILSAHEKRDMDAPSPILLDEKLGVSLRGLGKSRRAYRPSISSIAFKTKKFHDEVEEEMRLLYVATTRAEHELIIVDAIKSLDLYRSPLNARAILQNQSYTGWLLHTFLMHPSPLFALEEVKELYVRQEVNKPKRRRPFMRYYSSAVESIDSKTASQSKKDLHWKAVKLEKNERMRHGTLLHEIVAVLPYPYQEQAILRYDASKIDIDQILALNSNPLYRQWMEEKHQFECAYTVMQDRHLIHGFMDLVVFEEKQTIILDFKSDYVQEEKELVDRYRSQLSVYKEAMTLIEPEKPIRTYIYSFFLKRLIPVIC